MEIRNLYADFWTYDVEFKATSKPWHKNLLFWL